MWHHLGGILSIEGRAAGNPADCLECQKAGIRNIGRNIKESFKGREKGFLLGAVEDGEPV